MQIVKTQPLVIQILTFVYAHPVSIMETSVRKKLKITVIMKLMALATKESAIVKPIVANVKMAISEIYANTLKMILLHLVHK